MSAKCRNRPETQSKLFWLVGAGMLLTLSGCEIGMRLNVTGDLSNPVFSLSREQPFGSAEPCLTYLAVNKALPEGKGALMWSVKAANGCLPVKAVNYLGPNPGLVVLKPPAPLEENISYEVIANGWGRIGSCVFTYKHGHFEKDKAHCV